MPDYTIVAENCSRCRAKLPDTSIAQVVRVDVDPLGAERAHAGTINQLDCPSCGATGWITLPFAYVDRAASRLIVVDPDNWASMDVSARASCLVDEALSPLPEAERATLRTHLQIVARREDLAEALTLEVESVEQENVLRPIYASHRHLPASARIDATLERIANRRVAMFSPEDWTPFFLMQVSSVAKGADHRVAAAWLPLLPWLWEQVKTAVENRRRALPGLLETEAEETELLAGIDEARTASDIQAEATGLRKLAHYYLEHGAAELACTTCDTCESCAGRLGERLMGLEARVMRATALLAISEVGSAARLLNEVKAELDAQLLKKGLTAAEAWVFAVASDQMSNLLVARGELAAAKHYRAIVLTMLERLGMKEQLCQALLRAAVLCRDLAEFPQAVELYRRALELASVPNALRCNVLVDFGALYTTEHLVPGHAHVVGSVPEVVDHPGFALLAQGLQLATELGELLLAVRCHHALANAWLNLGRRLQQEGNSDALVFFEQIDGCVTAGRDCLARLATGAKDRQVKQLGAGLDIIEALLWEQRALRFEADDQVDAASVAWQNAYELVARHVSSSGTSRSAASPHDNIVYLALRALFAEHVGRLDDAAECYRTVTGTAEGARNANEAPAHRIVFQQTTASVYGRAARVALARATSTASRDLIDQAFTYSEAARARLLADQLGAYALIGNPTGFVRADEVAATLPSHAAMVAFGMMQHRGRQQGCWARFLIRRGSSEVIVERISLEDAAQAVTEFHRLVESVTEEIKLRLETGDADRLQRHLAITLPRQSQMAETLSNLLLPREFVRDLRTQGIDTLIVIPESYLWDVPFPALAHGMNVLVSPSATAWDALSKRDLARKDARVEKVLLLMDPKGDLPKRAALRLEDTVKRAFSNTTVTVLGGKHVNLDMMFEHGADADVIVYFGHGTVSARGSALVLADGDMTPRDLISRSPSQVFSRCRMFLLASCLVGRLDAHTAWRTREVDGIPAALLQLGASNVFGNLWPAAVGPTLAFMNHFLANISAGTSPPAALARAQAQTQLAESKHTHPYFWTSGLVIGGSC